MSARGMPLPAPLKAMSAEARQRWAALPPRERSGLTVAAIALSILLLWWVGIAPALRALRETPAQINVLDVQLQTMQRLAAESRELRGASPVPPSLAVAALQSATDRLGDKGRIAVQNDRATLTLTGVTGETLRAWLTEARSGARARPIEAQLSRGPEGYAGTIVLTIGGAQ